MRIVVILVAAGMLLAIAPGALAATLTFDDLITGQTQYWFDGDGDSVDDVRFWTTDPSGFNTVGPGTNMSYIDQPGLEGTSLLAPDLNVEFLVGAEESLTFGFAINTSTGGVYGVDFRVYDAGNNLIASDSVIADFTLPNGTNPSSFPEAIVSVAFAGTAARAEFDFAGGAGIPVTRYIIDNFTGKFGTTEVIPLPAAAWLGFSLLGALGLTRVVRRRKR